MNKRFNLYPKLGNIILSVLVICVIADILVLTIAIVRQSALEYELHTSISELQKTLADLHDTVDHLRAAASNPTVSADAEVIDAQLDAVEERLKILDENVDHPIFEPAEGGSEAENIKAAQTGFDEWLKILSWIIGVLSIVTALVLAWVLSARWREERKQLTIASVVLQSESGQGKTNAR